MSSSRDAVVSIPWWVKLCRWLHHALFFLWGTIGVGMIVATIANFNTTTTDTPLSKFYLIHIAITYPLLTVGIITLLLVLTVLSWIGSSAHSATRVLPPSEQNRLHLLQRLRSTYNNMITDSLQNAAWLELGLASKPGVVQNASTLLLRTPNQPERLLPVGTSIVEVYEQANHELLILGEPGTGKSMLLLHLAQHLIEQAVQDGAHPLPVILPLSSWAVKRLPLQEWLNEQFSLMYDVPQRFSKQWVSEEHLLLLLDGLDEMEKSAQAACIAAINAYHHDHLQPLVICSRTEEYNQAAASEQLALQNAVVVQALTPAQIDNYLDQAGQPLTALRAVLRKNSTLAALATTPLMLHILILIYHGASVKQLPKRAVLLRQQIWTDYVQHMVARKGDTKHYSLHRTTIWLSLLARQMRQHNQTIFYLEQLQLDWLSKAHRISYCLVFGLLSGLVALLVFGLLAGGDAVQSLEPIRGWVFTLAFTLAFALFMGVGIGLIMGVGIGRGWLGPIKIPTFSWKKLEWKLSSVLLGGLYVGLLGWLMNRQIRGLVSGLLSGLVLGLLSKQFPRLIQERYTERRTPYSNEGIQRNLKNGISLMVVFGVAGGLPFGVGGGLPTGLIVGLIAGLFMGVGIGLIDAVRHYMLRLWLRQTNTFPWKAQEFLDDATTRILLRRIGEGYSFTHRLLLDYFAGLHVG